MSEFRLALFEDALPKVEDFMEYINRKELTTATAKRLKVAKSALKTLRNILEAEMREAGEEAEAERLRRDRTR